MTFAPRAALLKIARLALPAAALLASASLVLAQSSTGSALRLPALGESASDEFNLGEIGRAHV